MLKEIYKFFNSKARVFNDSLKGFWRDDFACMERHDCSAAVIFKFNMASFLTNRMKSSFVKSTDDFFSCKPGKFLHQTAISKSCGWNRRSLRSSRLMSLGSGSRYSSMASLIFLIASCFVVPQEWQPFKEGQYAWYPSLLGSFSIMILNFIELPPIRSIAQRLIGVKAYQTGQTMGVRLPSVIFFERGREATESRR